MKRRIFACVLACVMLLSAIPFAVFAEGTDAVCPGFAVGHDKTNCTAYTLVEEVPAKCGKQGYNRYECDVCGKNFAADFTAALGEHEWEKTTDEVPATCDTPGTTEVYTCTKCGETKGGDAIAQLAHQWKVVVDGSSVGCAGYTKRVCELCGKEEIIYNDTDGLHDWTSAPVRIETEPTCQTEGVAVYQCTSCNVEKKIPIAKIHCSHLVDYVEAVAPTCTTAGNIEYWVCSVCGTKYSEAGAVNVITNVVVDALGHDLVNGTLVDKLDATCTDAGYTDIKCARCGEVIHTDYAALGHKDKEVEKKDPTCSENGYIKYECERCGRVTEVVLPMTNHANSYVTDVVYPTCTMWGYEMKKCNDCGFTWQHQTTDELYAPLGHTTFDDATSTNKDDYTNPVTCETSGIRTWNCGRCNEAQSEFVEKTGHKEVTVVVAATCIAGSYTYTYCTNTHCDKALVTEYIDAETGRKFAVDLSGAPVHFLSIVTFDDIKDENNHVDPHEEVVYPATCTEPGREVHYCSACDKRDQNVVLEPTGHDYQKSAALSTAPDCLNPGENVYVCTKCGDSYTEAVDALGHDWVAGTPVLPNCQMDGYTTYTCDRCGATEDRDIVEWVSSVVNEPAMWDTPGVKWFYENKQEAEADGHIGLCDDAQRTVFRDGHCTLAGLYSYACSGCGKSVLVRIEGTGLGHNYVEIVPGLDATCTDDGYTPVYECDVCHNVIPSKKIDALGHNFVVDAAVAPTCENTGLTEGSHCNRCGLVEKAQDVILATGHTYGEWIPALDPTCTQDGYVAHYTCAACGKYFDENKAELATIVIPANGHDVMLVDQYLMYDCVKYAYWHWDCPNCDDLVDINGNYIDFINKYIPATGHNLVKDDAASYGPTCEDEGKNIYYCTNGCSGTGDYEYAGEEIIPALGHHNAAGELIEKVCTSPVTDRFCVTCNTEIAKEHSIIINAVAPTCNKEGHDFIYCENCDHSEEANFKPGLGDHNWGAWHEIVAPTFTTEGKEERYCTNGCGSSEERTVPTKIGLEFNMIVDNATIAGSKITDSSLVAVTITATGYNTPVNNILFNLNYDPDMFQYVKCEFGDSDPAVNTGLTAMTMANDNGGYISIAAQAPITNGQVVDHMINGTEVLAVVYFRVNYVNGETMTAPVNTLLSYSFGKDAVLNAAGVELDIAHNDAIVNVFKFMDVSGEGRVTNLDVQDTVKMIIGETGYAAYDAVVDVNKDGVVDYVDAEYICKYTIGAVTYDELRQLGTAA